MSSNQSEPILIQAAGRILSQSNADTLLTSYLQIGKVLSLAGVLDLKDVEGLEKLFNSAEEEEEVAAASLQSDVRRVAWREKLRRTCGLFLQRFCQIYEMPDLDFAKKYPNGNNDRKEIADELLADFNLLVNELIGSAPDPLNDPEERYSLPYMGDYMGLSNSEDYISLSKPIAEEESKVMQVTFDCPAQEEIIIDVEAASSNKFPVKGVLFRIDEPSESAPSVGPNLPLYISLAVAQSILPQVQGLPLDADDNLSRHANKEITGVLQAGEIKDNDFVVHGHLFPFNQAGKVEAISKAKNKLGMSMNAKAVGSKALIDGKEVFEVTKLELLGANILYSDKATYRKTSLIAASNNDEVNNQEEEESMSDPVVAQQLQKMYETLLQMQSQQDAELANFRGVIQEVQLDVQQIRDEKQAEQENLQTQTLALQRQEQEDQLLAKLGDVVEQKFKQLRNPSGQPPRITTPLAASSNNATADPLSAVQQELIVAEAKLAGMRESNGSRAARIAASQQVSTLKAQLGIR